MPASAATGTDLELEMLALEEMEADTLAGPARTAALALEEIEVGTLLRTLALALDGLRPEASTASTRAELELTALALEEMAAAAAASAPEMELEILATAL